MYFGRGGAFCATVSASLFILLAGCSSPTPNATASTQDGDPDASSTPANVDLEHPSLALARRIASAHERLSHTLAPTDDAWVRETISSTFTSPGWRATDRGELGYLGARTPERANGFFEVGLGRFERFRLRFTELDASDVAPTLHEGRMVYETMHRATDAILTTNLDRWEEVLLLKSADAPTSFSWSVKMPSGLSASVNDKVGSVVFIDRKEKPVLWMPRPYAIDANGEHRDATLTWTDGSDGAAKFEVKLDTKDLAYPIVLDPAIETAVWVHTADYDSFQPMSDLGMGYDGMIGKTLVVYGGQFATAAVNTPPYDKGVIDTGPARYTGNAWVFTTDTSQIVNPQRERMAMTSLISEFGFPVFFGGEICTNGTSPCTSLAVTNDSYWLTNGIGWFPVTNDNTAACVGQVAGVACGPGNIMVCDGANHCLPTKRRSATMAEQPGGNGDFVAFGGTNVPGTVLSGDTCTFIQSSARSSHGVWTCTLPATRPSPRFDAAMVFDTVRNVDVLYGGTTSSTGASGLADTWEWNGAAWTQRCAACAPGGRWGHRMAYDSNLQRTVLVGGYTGAADLADTWEWDGTTWSPICGAGGKPACATGALKSGAMAYDAGRRRSVYVGGTVSGNPFTNLALPSARSATWEYHGRGGACNPANAGADCDTGNCVSETVGGVATSVCCETSSCPTCQQCDATGSPGVCSLIPQGTDNNANASGACTGTSTCDGNGRCLTKNGQTCTSSGQCAFFNCADIGVPNSGDPGVCCDSACGQSCDVCKSTLGASVTGTCAILAAGANASPSGSCGGYLCAGAAGCPTSCTTDAQCISGYYCGAGNTCQQKKANGLACGCGTSTTCSECSSGNCYDSVCCDSACGGTCAACTAAKKGSGSDGACGTIAAGTDPDNECTDNGAASCGTNGNCSGHGTCDNYTAGTSCGAASCSGTTVTLKQCNGTGSCLSVSGSNCDPYICAAGTCKNPCVVDTDCVNGDYCAAGICKAKSNNGIGCTAANQCITNSCVDGFCCNSACSGACDVCNATPGTCTLVAQGSAGAPACGSGFVCTGSSANCPATCGSDNDCAAGFFCNSTGACQAQKASTGSCDLTADCKVAGCRECTTGFCSDGVCCNSACGGACDSCNALGSVGTCTNVTGPGSPSCGGILCTGSSPTCPTGCTTDAQCAGGYYCSANGTCQARKAQGQSCNLATDCKQAGACSECGSAGGCVDGFCCNSACGGACDNCSATPGTCSFAATGFPGNPSCGTYLCNGSSATCPGSCTLDAQCSTGNYCNGTSCAAKKTLGTGCGVGKECTSGFCADGVCCDGACGGPCDACNSSGQCLNAVGAGAPSCSPYVCSGTSPACPPSCTSDANCAGGFFCNGSACVPKLGLGQGCTGANQCALSNCVDGVCCASACGGACDSCNSSGQCVNVAGGGNPTCGAYLCSGTAPACPSTCSTDAQCATGYFCTQGGTCQPQKSQGQSCGVTDCSQAGCRECSTGNCADGFCCNQVCNGACDTCSATAGVCTFSAAGNAGAPACAPYLCSGSAGSCPASCTSDAQCSTGNFCDGVACVAKRVQGAACSAKNQCASDSCVDGVCCNTACNTLCHACSAALKESGITDGVCDVAKAGGDPHNECTADNVSTCQHDGTCDGTGKCRLYAAGTSCGGGTSCVLDTVTGNVCDGAGNCSPNATGTNCAPYKCSGTKCAIPCASDNDCQTGNFCDLAAGGTCKPQLAQGKSCSGTNQCLSSFCVDGACCDKKCDGFCEACNATKGAALTGTCGPIANGLDPDNECPDNGATVCKEDGYCNGSGACRFYDNTTVCGPSQCVSGVTTTQKCNGTGTCGIGTVTNCAPFTCDITGATCALACVDDTLCGLGNYCASGLCVPKIALAQPCTADNECTSLHCVENVCCDSKCDGTCQSCTDTLKQSGDQTGTCGPAKADTDPHNNCIDDGVTGCQHNGNCDGQGQCALYKNGASCGDTTCVGDKTMGFQQSGFACNGGGSCLANAVVDCGQFACKNSACLATCTDSTDCRDGAFCDQTAMPPVCKLKSKSGTKCTAADQCESQSCVDGYCCNTACQGQCEACDIAGTEGSCAPVSGKPHGTRTECAKATADNVCAEAQCDGNTRTTCAGFVGSTAECRPAACKGGVATLSAKCDGKGQCPAQTTKVCEPYGCDTTTCKESCKGDSDCTSGYRCDTGSEGGTAGSFKCLSGATCDGDHTISAPNQPATNCSPYKCQAGGTCKTQCASVDDCAAGFGCDLDGKCAVETFNQAPGSAGGCGCRIGESPENRLPPGWTASLFLGLAVVVRSRRSRRSRNDRT